MISRAKSLLFDDLWLKLLALALAMVTWLYIDAELHELQTTPASRPFVTLPALQE